MDARTCILVEGVAAIALFTGMAGGATVIALQGRSVSQMGVVLPCLLEVP